MLRLARYTEAEAVLSAAGGHTTTDAQITSSMLLAMARISLGMPDDGLQILQGASEAASGSHRSIRSEIELYRAYAYFAKRDMLPALRHIGRVAVDSDVIHARSLQLQGFIYSWLGRKRDAAAAYAAALSRLDNCRRYDFVVGAAATAGLSVIAYEINDLALMRMVETRYATMKWPVGNTRYRVHIEGYRHQIEANIGDHADFSGDPAKAAAFHALALKTASGNASTQAGSFALLSRIAGHARDHAAARAHLASAWKILDALDAESIEDNIETPWAFVETIRQTAAYDVARARELSARHAKLKTNPLAIHAGSFQHTALMLFVEGLMLKAEGDLPTARQRLHEAHEAFRICELTPEAIETAHWLAMLGDTNMQWYVVGSLAGTKNWMTAMQTIPAS
jgi:hypothetical protein